MMKKYFGFVSAAGLVGAVALVACTSTDNTSSSSSGSAATTDGGKVDATPKPKPDTGTTTDSCYVEADAATYKKEYSAPTKGQGKCTAATFASFKTACFDMGATEATCTAWRTANADCNACLLGGAADSGSLVLPAIIVGQGGIVSSTFAACAYTVAGADPTCARAAMDSSLCVISACGSCTDNATLQACGTEAEEGACKASAPAAACDTAAMAKQAEIDAACKGADFDATLEKTALFFCGPSTN